MATIGITDGVGITGDGMDFMEIIGVGTTGIMDGVGITGAGTGFMEIIGVGTTGIMDGVVTTITDTTIIMAITTGIMATTEIIMYIHEEEEALLMEIDMIAIEIIV
jgi:hypothetical protein